MPIYHPTNVALKVLTLQQIAGSRLLLGVGAGSTESDYLIHQADFKCRFSAFDTHLAELRQALEQVRSLV